MIVKKHSGTGDLVLLYRGLRKYVDKWMSCYFTWVPKAQYFLGKHTLGQLGCRVVTHSCGQSLALRVLATGLLGRVEKRKGKVGAQRERGRERTWITVTGLQFLGSAPSASLRCFLPSSPTWKSHCWKFHMWTSRWFSKPSHRHLKPLVSFVSKVFFPAILFFVKGPALLLVLFCFSCWEGKERQGKYSPAEEGRVREQRRPGEVGLGKDLENSEVRDKAKLSGGGSGGDKEVKGDTWARKHKNERVHSGRNKQEKGKCSTRGVMHCKQTHKSTLGPMNLYIKIILNHIPWGGKKSIAKSASSNFLMNNLYWLLNREKSPKKKTILIGFNFPRSNHFICHLV